MKFKKLNGYEANLNLRPYLIKWDAPCRSKFQFAVKQFFREFWQRHYCYEEMLIPGSGGCSLDLVNLTKRVAVEAQGVQHTKRVKIFQPKAEDFSKQIQRDVLKHRWAQLNNLQLIEIHPENLPLTKEWIIETFGQIL